MFWLGLLLTICFVPGWVGATVPTQWALLSAILPLGLWLPGITTVGHRLLLILLAWAIIGLAWANNLYSAVYGLWWLCIWIMAYHFGTRFHSLRNIWMGIGVGFAINAVFILAQMFGFDPVQTVGSAQPVGLFFNPAFVGVLSGLVIVGLVCNRLWLLIPFPAFAMVTSGSRGGYPLILVGLAARYLGPWGAASVFVTASVLFALSPVNSSDMQRMELWAITYNVLKPLGWGVGAYKDVFYIQNNGLNLIWAENAHNDILQMAYEYGIVALAPLAVFAMALTRTRSRNWPALVALATAAIFFFPLYTPIMAFLGFCMAGNSLRAWALDGAYLRRRGHDLLLWNLAQRPTLAYPRGADVPLGQRTAHTEP